MCDSGDGNKVWERGGAGPLPLVRAIDLFHAVSLEVGARRLNTKSRMLATPMSEVAQLRAFLKLGRPQFLIGGLLLFALGAVLAKSEIDWQLYVWGQATI